MALRCGHVGRLRNFVHLQVWGIFPPEWHLPQLVCLAFCTITKSHLAEILDAKVHILAPCIEPSMVHTLAMLPAARHVN